MRNTQESQLHKKLWRMWEVRLAKRAFVRSGTSSDLQSAF